MDRGIKHRAVWIYLGQMPVKDSILCIVCIIPTINCINSIPLFRRYVKNVRSQKAH